MKDKIYAYLPLIISFLAPIFVPIVLFLTIKTYYFSLEILGLYDPVVEQQKKEFLKIGDYKIEKNKQIEDLSNLLTKNCEEKDKLCKIKALHKYVSNLPYRKNYFCSYGMICLSTPYQDKTDFYSPLDVIKNNGGDCDEKSLLLSSLFYFQDIENYFVAVKKHIFVVVNLEQILPNKNYMIIKNKPFYRLETTAKNSKIADENLKLENGERAYYTQKDILAVLNLITKQSEKKYSVPYEI